MKLSISMMNSAGWILSGFSSATTIILRDVAFLVKVGFITQQVLLSIVEELGPYKTIMGQV